MLFYKQMFDIIEVGKLFTKGGFDTMNEKLALFEEKEIRKTWKDKKWYFKEWRLGLSNLFI